MPEASSKRHKRFWKKCVKNTLFHSPCLSKLYIPEANYWISPSVIHNDQPDWKSWSMDFSEWRDKLIFLKNPYWCLLIFKVDFMRSREIYIQWFMHHPCPENNSKCLQPVQLSKKWMQSENAWEGGEEQENPDSVIWKACTRCIIHLLATVKT